MPSRRFGAGFCAWPGHGANTAPGPAAVMKVSRSRRAPALEWGPKWWAWAGLVSKNYACGIGVWLRFCRHAESSRPAFNVDDFTPASASGKILARLPRSMHLQLKARAKTEGVSLNSLVLALIAEGLGKRNASRA